MIETSDMIIDLGNLEMKIKVISNSEKILTEAMTEEETPLWVELWPSALALSKLLWEGPSLAGKTVLELGAGLGLPGVVAGLKGAGVLQTDYIADALKVAEQTAQMNNVQGIRTAVADWRNFEINECFDLIIGSDIMYHPDLNPCLKRIFQRNLKTGGQVIMADAGRNDSLDFVITLKQEGWGVNEERIPVKQGRFDYKIYVFRILPPALSP